MSLKNFTDRSGVHKYNSMIAFFSKLIFRDVFAIFPQWKMVYQKVPEQSHLLGLLKGEGRGGKINRG